MSIKISPETEARLNNEAQKSGLSVEALLAQLLNEHAIRTEPVPRPELPLWHLGVTGSLHRRDIYDDAG